MTIYTAEQIRQIEAAEFARRDSYSIMQQAGRAVVHEAQKMLQSKTARILLVAGSGNNGGDACVAATYLRQAEHHQLALYMPAPPKPKDAQKALQGWRDSGGTISNSLDTFAQDQGDLIIDGIFGIGLNRPVEGEWLYWINAINQKRAEVLAIDIPSGLHTDTGMAMGKCVHAQKTLSFFGAKVGFYQNAGAEACGMIVIEHLGRQSTAGDIKK